LIVIDASVALAWSFHDERTEANLVVSRMVADNGARVPAMWPYEVANTFRMAVRKGRISPALRQALIDSLNMLPIEIDLSISESMSAISAISDHRDLTVYDASYIELARRMRLPLATPDIQMSAAARSEGVPVLP
jgi:predicted nucleic acid-binding protein